MPQIDFRLGVPAALAIIASLAAVAIAIAFYRRTLPPVTRRRRIFLTVLRSLALTLITLLLFEPFIRLIYTRSVPPTLAVLVDDSRSMSLADRSGRRDDITRSLLRSQVLSELSDRAQLRIIPFGVTAQIGKIGVPDSLTFAQDGTDISAALDAVQHQDQVLQSGAVLLISDGITTLGRNPLSSLPSFPVPVTTVGIGDSTEQRDLRVDRVASNTVVYSGTPTPVQVKLHASGYHSERITVVLTDGSTLVGRSTLSLVPGSRDYDASFLWTPATDGVRTLTASVNALPDELTTRNNRRTLSVRVRKTKLRILILAGEPSHDLAFFRATAEEDSTITVSARIQKHDGGFYEGPITQALFDSADCLVLIGFPTPATLASTCDGLAAALARAPLPLFWISGPTMDYTKAGQLGAALPFTDAQTSAGEQEISLEPTAAELSTPLLTPQAPGESPPWLQLPPVYSTRTRFAPRPGTTVLATARIQSVTTPTPALLVGTRPRRSVALLCYGIWRWRLLAQRSPAVATFFPQFVSNTIRWLTAPDDTAPVIVRPLSPLYGQGEPLTFTAQVRDVQQRPIEDAEVRVVVYQHDQAIEGVLPSAGNGRYEGTVRGLSEEGVYNYRATAGKAGMVLGADSGTVRIGGTHVEFLTTQTNTSLLRAIAARTGGTYLTPEAFGRLPEELERQGFFAPRTLTDGKEIHARSWPYLAMAIVLLLAIEWIIRKRSGML